MVLKDAHPHDQTTFRVVRFREDSGTFVSEHDTEQRARVSASMFQESGWSVLLTKVVVSQIPLD